MIDFLYWRDWWTQKHKNMKVINTRRYYTFKIALNLLLQYNGNIIIETGTQRMENDPAGSSTTLFGSFCKHYGKKLYTVDNDIEHMILSKKLTEEYKDYIEYVYSDSIEFLRNFDKPIDLLYLDSLDCPLPPESALTSQLHQLNEIKAAYKNLHVNSIVLLDDNAFENGGKTKLSKKFLYDSKEFLLVLDDIQSLWVKIK